VDERLRILVVEDDPVYAEFVTMVLRGAGHDVAHATTGALAREAVRAHTPDAVVLDLVLPDESGYDLARALRELLPAAVILLLTADLFPQLDRAEAAGIDIVLSKPVEADLVTGMIDHIRARRRRRVSSPPSA
jgi:two-component system OmpR family response regulator